MNAGNVTQEFLAFVQARMMKADYARCRPCDKKRIEEGRTNDICEPINGPGSMSCNDCGAVREPYDCQSDEWMIQEGGQ